MSVTVKDGSSKEIKAFKEAFGQHAKPKNLLSSWLSTPSDPLPFLQNAKALLTKRMTFARLTLVELAKDKPANQWKVVGDLTALAEKKLVPNTLNLLTDAELLLDMKPTKKGEEPPPVDPTTKGMIDMVDVWVNFEAKCIAARNQLTGVTDEGALKKKLQKRADDMLGLAGTLQSSLPKKPPAPPELAKQINTVAERLQLMVTAAGVDGTKIDDADAFGRELDGCRTKLQELTQKLGALSGSPPDLHKTALKAIYGLDIKAGDEKDKDKIPYRQIFEAFGMVPSDQAVNAMLEKMEYTTIEGHGGDFSSDDKRIRIDPALSLGSDQEYINPETGKPEKVNSFAVTTLHEIGHSVDAAYKLMDANKGKPGCGGWKEQEPFAYVAATYEEFGQKLQEQLAKEKDFKVELEDDNLKQAFFRCMIGKMKDDEFVELIWNDKIEAEFQKKKRDAATNIQLPTQKLQTEITKFFKADLGEKEIEALYEELKVKVASLLTALTTAEPPVFKEEDFHKQFDLLFGNAKTAPKEGVKSTPLSDWALDQYLAAFLKCDSDKAHALIEPAKWTVVAKQCLPKQIDLSKYFADKEPWEKDISGDPPIGGIAPSHQAYSKDTKWWRYDGTARASTKVNNYQWRAPGEWFAEVYAISWFKKVEPPKAVPDDIRPYLYGGILGKPG